MDKIIKLIGQDTEKILNAGCIETLEALPESGTKINLISNKTIEISETIDEVIELLISNTNPINLRLLPPKEREIDFGWGK